MALSSMEVGDKLSHQPRKSGCLDHLRAYYSLAIFLCCWPSDRYQNWPVHVHHEHFLANLCINL